MEVDLLKYVERRIKKLWRRNRMLTIAFLVIALVLVVLYFLFYKELPSNTLGNTIFNKNNISLCQSLDSTLYHGGTTNDNFNYITLKLDSIKISENFKIFRQRQLQKLLKKADSLLIESGFSAYGSEIYKHLKSKSETSEIIIDEFISKSFFYIEEKLIPVGDSKECLYNITISLEKRGSNNIRDIITFVEDKKCVDNTIDELIFNPLDSKDIIKVSFYDIYKNLCINCSKVKRVRNMIDECKTDNCDNIYFESGKYKLSLISKMILLSLRDRLYDTKNNINIEFHGFTDPKQYSGSILYSAGARFAANGELLDNSSNEMPITKITSNEELSFTRAYSCYEFMESSLKLDNVKFQYTGWGVNESPISNQEKRAVLIIIKK